MKKTAVCTCCGLEFFTDTMVKVKSPKRGENNAYMCNRCASQNEGYHADNNKILGTTKANEVKCGLEFETSFSDDLARLQMFEYGFIPTHDGSLNSDGHGSRYGWDGNACEYVSGIMNGLNRPSKLCNTVEALINEGHLKINDSCGTHFHVSIDSMKDENGEKTYMNYIRRFYNSLFVPLSNALKDCPEATKKLFGRNFSNWAREITMHSTQTTHDDRYHFINCLADTNIEFRLNKFINAKQYQTLMKFEVEVVKIIVTNFCEHFNEEPKDKRRYTTKTEYRKHKAQVTANKIVKLFEKTITNI